MQQLFVSSLSDQPALLPNWIINGFSSIIFLEYSIVLLYILLPGGNPHSKEQEDIKTVKNELRTMRVLLL